MQIFQEVQKSFISLGFNPKEEPFNHKIVGILAATLLAVISLWIFLIHEANSAESYMESIYDITAATGLLLSLASTVFIKQKLFSFIGSFDEFLNECELNFKHLNISKNVKCKYD